MGTGNYPNVADCVEHKFVKEECPYSYEEFLTLLDKSDMSFDNFADCIANRESDATSFGIDEDVFRTLNRCWKELQEVFKENTRGLELYLVYHNADNRGDELNGASFAVDGVYQLTPAGEKYQHLIQRKAWTEFG